MRIVRTKRYVKDLKRLGVATGERDVFERAIAADPTAGDVVQGLRGIRKLRFAFGGRGKSGGRVIYFLQLTDDTALLLTAYAKNEKVDLSSDDRKALLGLVKELTDG
jgi:hypothetical protein